MIKEQPSVGPGALMTLDAPSLLNYSGFITICMLLLFSYGYELHGFCSMDSWMLLPMGEIPKGNLTIRRSRNMIGNYY